MRTTIVTIHQPEPDSELGKRLCTPPIELAIGLSANRLPHIAAITHAAIASSSGGHGDGHADDTGHSTAATIDFQFPQTLDAGLSISEFPTILPTQAEGWTGTPAIQVSRDGRELFPALKVVSHSWTDNSLRFEAIDPEGGLTLDASIAIGPEGLIRIDTALTNAGDNPLTIARLTPVVPLPPQIGEIQTCTGHHLRERALQRQPLTEGLFAKDSHMGRPDFNAATLLVAGVPGFGFEHGLTFGAHVAFSGNSTVFAERTPYTHGIIGGGELPYAGEITLQQGETYHAPRLLVSVGDGLNAVAARFHAYLRSFHPELASTPRPVTLNTWEAMYFDQNEEKVIALADRAASIGIERFVIDDGWFTGRRDDTKGLGDWQVDHSIWPHGLHTVADHVHGLGMGFGLWFEPEMISPDSDTARAHPDWILAPNATRMPV